MFRGILTEQQTQILAREVWPKFRKERTIVYADLFEEMVRWGRKAQLEFEPEAVVGWWVNQEFLEVSPSHTQFRFMARAIADLEKWEEEDRLWNSGHHEPMPLNKRLRACFENGIFPL